MSQFKYGEHVTELYSNIGMQ